jgi:hypothetical protein
VGPPGLERNEERSMQPIQITITIDGTTLRRLVAILSVLLILGVLLAQPGGVFAAVPYTFTTGNTISSSQMNANFAYLDSFVSANNSRLSALEAILAGVSRTGNEVYFTGVNVHVRNGDGSAVTSSTNGLGNLIIGYNETSGQTRTGSHNLVVGPEHAYESFGGIVTGQFNRIAGPAAVVLGGAMNQAEGPCSTIAGSTGCYLAHGGVTETSANTALFGCSSSDSAGETVDEQVWVGDGASYASFGEGGQNVSCGDEASNVSLGAMNGLTGTLNIGANNLNLNGVVNTQVFGSAGTSIVIGANANNVRIGQSAMSVQVGYQATGSVSLGDNAANGVSLGNSMTGGAISIGGGSVGQVVNVGDANSNVSIEGATYP